jgi:hypothetical protein
MRNLAPYFMELTLEKKMYRITHKLMYCLKMFVYNAKCSSNIGSRMVYNYAEWCILMLNYV